jgi:hypothetical protein
MERKMTKTQIGMRIFTVAIGIIAGVIVIAAIGVALQQWGLALMLFSLKVTAAMAVMGAVSGLVEFGYTRLLKRGAGAVRSWKDIDVDYEIVE